MWFGTNQKDLENMAGRLGIRDGDSVLIHSSFKSLGRVEGGADAVIDAFLEAVGPEGTVIVPTLCQNDWEHVYENWHMDAPSDVGYITNVFRKRENAFRSNQATHSVAAIGKDAEYITKNHGETGRRQGIFGDTPFSADSPWEKMYQLNTKIVFLGVNMICCTARHYAEYVFMENCLNSIKCHPDYEKMASQLWCYERWSEQGVWPHIRSVAMQEYLSDHGMLKMKTCGNATVLCVNTKDFVDTAIRFMEQINTDYLWDAPETEKWIKKVYELSK